MVAFRRPKSLNDYIVRAKLRSTRTEDTPVGTVKYGDRRCQVCDYYLSFSSRSIGRKYSINFNLDCNTTNVLYMLECKVCGVQYKGSSSTKFRLRFNNHKSRIKAHTRLRANEKLKDDLIYRHFNSPGHNGLADVTVKLIDIVNDEKHLLDKEGQWAYRIKCIKPHGLNESI